jgi:hypothetical protein
MSLRTILILYYHLVYAFDSQVNSSNFPSCKDFVSSHLCYSIWSTHLILFDSIILIIFNVDYKIQDVHMKCWPLYYNITHEPNSKGSKTKCICRLYGHVHNLCRLTFQILPLKALHSHLFKWRLKHGRIKRAGQPGSCPECQPISGAKTSLE